MPLLGVHHASHRSEFEVSVGVVDGDLLAIFVDQLSTDHQNRLMSMMSNKLSSDSMIKLIRNSFAQIL